MNNNGRSYYSGSPFGQGGYSQALVQAPTLGRSRVFPLSPTRAISPYRPPTQHPGLGQDWGGALDIFESLIGNVPVDLAGDFEARRDACLEKSLINRYECLIKRTRDVRDAVKGEGSDTPPPVTPPNGGIKKDPPSEFPWVPVGIGAVAVLAIGYAIATKGQ